MVVLNVLCNDCTIEELEAHCSGLDLSTLSLALASLYSESCAYKPSSQC